MSEYNGLIGGLVISLLVGLITWWFRGLDNDKQKGARLAFDSEKTAESLKKVELQIEELRATNTLHSKTLNSIEENSALFEQREQNMEKTLNRMEGVMNNVLTEFVKSNNNLANAINLQSEYLKEHSKQK